MSLKKFFTIFFLSLLSGQLIDGMKFILFCSQIHWNFCTMQKTKNKKIVTLEKHLLLHVIHLVSDCFSYHYFYPLISIFDYIFLLRFLALRKKSLEFTFKNSLYSSQNERKEKIAFQSNENDLFTKRIHKQKKKNYK